MKNYLKISGLTALVVSLAACSTLQGNTNNTKKLSTRCLNVVPMAVGEVDANVVSLSSQVCKSPQSADLWQQLAQQFFNIGRYDKAIQAGNATLKLQPDNAAAKDIVLRSGLKVTEKSLTQMKGNMQFLYGDAWSEANQVAGQISRARGEKPLELNTVSNIQAEEAEAAKKSVPKKTTVYTSKPKKATAKKAAPAAKAKAPAAKPSSKPSNPFSSFN